MNDLISRQAAIDALLNYIHNVDKVIGTGRLSPKDCKDAATSVLAGLPSAQPEIIRCKDCRNNHWCNIQEAAMAGDNFFCGAAERRTDD